MGYFVSVFIWVLERLKLSLLAALKCFGIILLSTLVIASSAFADDDDDDDDDDEDFSFSYLQDVLGSNNIAMNEIDLRLEPFDFDLMGDMRDPHTGTLAFATTDVSLPGNSDLPVAISRRAKAATSSNLARYLEDGADDVFFGDWILEVPSVSHIELEEAPRRPISHSQSVTGCASLSNDGEHYDVIGSGGFKLNIPGVGSQVIVDYFEGDDDDDSLPAYFLPFNRDGSRPGYGISGQTKNHWVAGCNQQGANGSRLTTIQSPNGTIYKIGHKSRVDLQRHTTHQYISPSDNLFQFDNPPAVHLPKIDLLEINRARAVKTVHYVTEVTDIKGNWVKYDYNDLGQLTRIYSNDDREITLSYMPNTRNISSVTANGRTWTYEYRKIARQVNEKYIASEPNGWGRVTFAERNITKHELSLHKVILPDGTYWEYDIRGLTHFGYRHPDVAGDFNSRVDTILNGLYRVNGTFTGPRSNEPDPEFIADVAYSRVYPEGNNDIYVKHPYGTRADYVLGDRVMPSYIYRGKTLLEEDRIRTVLSKTISGPNMPTSTWEYEIEDQRSAEHVSLSKTLTTMTRPDGSKQLRWCFNYGTLEGKTTRTEIRAHNGTLLEATDYTYTNPQYFGHTYRGNEENYSRGSSRNGMIIRHDGTSYDAYVSEKKVKRGSDVYTTKYTYDLDEDSPRYSYGKPIKTEIFTNISGSTTPRIVERDYSHLKDKWLLNLQDKVTVNDREIARFDYDNYGRVTKAYRYGELYKSYGYYTVNGSVFSGALFWSSDGIGRRIYAHNWKRGIPQRVRYPDNSNRYRYVDDNGWPIRDIDALGTETLYEHDEMGRVTKVNAPSGWDDTDIEYSFDSNGALQTITKGQSRETITYDTMFRHMLEETQDISTGWSSFVNTEYDNMGRVRFMSQPSSNESESKGAEYSFDGLGRILSRRENVAPYAETTHEYHSLGRVYKTDPSGLTTQYWPYGYDGPDSTNYRLIRKYDGNTHIQTTNLYKDVWGQMSQLQQSGSLDGVSANKSQYFYYNAQQRLCRHYVPEHGATLYNYDFGGQMRAYAKGQPNTGCTVPLNNDRVDLTYDSMGRVTHTDFADPATPDITVTYDANGNVLSNSRGSGASAISWAYDYNEVNMLTSEQLSVDGLAYDLAYKYNSAGNMTQKTLPSGRVVDYTPDGLGRYSSISENGNNLASNMDYHASGALLHMNYGNGVEFSQTLNARLLPHRLTTRKVTGTSTRTDWVSSSGPAAPAPAPAPAPEPIVIDVWKSKHSWLADAWCETNAPKYLTASWLGFYCELTQVTQPAPEPEPAPAPASAPTQTAVSVTQVDFATGPVSELDLTYSYDAMGRIIQQTNGVNSHHNRSYSYDALGQLKTANSPAWGNASYNYDPIGNLLSKTIGGRTVTNSYNNLNRITKSVDTANGSRIIAHDSRGNVTRLGALYMSYDMSDQPVSVTGTGRTGKAANGLTVMTGNSNA